MTLTLKRPAAVSLTILSLAAAGAISATPAQARPLAPYPDCHSYISVVRTTKTSSMIIGKFNSTGGQMRSLMYSSAGLVHVDGDQYNASWTTGVYFQHTFKTTAKSVTFGLSITDDENTITYCAGTFTI